MKKEWVYFDGEAELHVGLLYLCVAILRVKKSGGVCIEIIGSQPYIKPEGTIKQTFPTLEAAKLAVEMML